MLRFLSIKRLAVIDAVEVEFEPGLNVLTGETGAGKSILVEAVGLLLGGRASGDLVRTGEDVATIEAIFESGGEELLVRREITAQGRSRAYINGELATAGALKDLSRRLIELHGQHEHHTLLDPATHLDVVDNFGGLGRLTEQVAGLVRPMARERGRTGPRQACGVRARRPAGARGVPARRARSRGIRLGRRGRRTGRCRARCWPTPNVSSGSARKPMPRCTRATARCWRSWGRSGAVSRTWRRSTRGFSRTSTRATASSRSSKTWRCFCGGTPTASTRRRPGCSRSRSVSRCSSV